MTDAVENQYIEMAYARVSSKNQTLARQEASILNAVPDLKAKYFYKDKWTGKEFDRPEYAPEGPDTLQAALLRRWQA